MNFNFDISSRNKNIGLSNFSTALPFKAKINNKKIIIINRFPQNTKILNNTKKPLLIEKIQKSVVENLKPVVENLKPVVENLEPAVENLKPVVENLEPAVENLEPVVENLEPAVENLKPVVENLKPVVENLEPVVENLEPVKNDKEKFYIKLNRQLHHIIF